MTHALLVSAVALLLGSVTAEARERIVEPATAATSTAARHDVHVSVSRVVFEDGTLFWRIRCFADDLELALRELAGDSTFTLATAASARSDSLAARYFRRQVQVSADGRRATPRLVTSGSEDDDDGGPVRWYLFAFPVGADPAVLRIRHAVLFDVYRDQQNLVTFLDAARDVRQPLYFTAGNDRAQELRRR